jgi:uncharacterized repeat protein (TIGR04076 family)
MKKTLIISVKETIGNCPVYKIGDKIVIDEGYKINLGKSTAICMHSLASIFPYYVALSNGISPNDIGLSKIDLGKKTKERDKDLAYVQCLDPCKYTGGGTVVFEIKVK